MDSLLSDGFTLMWIGMGTVFVFLVVLVLATQVMSALINKFYPEKVFIPEDMHSVQAIDDETLAVIKEAIRVHRIQLVNKR
jgi:oxaloacetate decarboxylase gamma subunit